MTRTQQNKTFYAKAFEPILRHYFKCPSKTPVKDKVYPYFFLQNHDNITHKWRSPSNGMSDVYLKGFNKDFLEEKYLTFFTFMDINDFTNNTFTIGIDKWNQFLDATNKSNENNIWGVFCIDSDNFILAPNTAFDKENIIVKTKQCSDYSLELAYVNVSTGIHFHRHIMGKHGWNWLIEAEVEDQDIKKTVRIEIAHDENYSGILPKESFCMPFPRVGKKHLFCIRNGNNFYFEETTVQDIASRFHDTDTVKNYANKVYRMIKTNENKFVNNLRLKALNTIICAIPDEMEKEDFIEWQQCHKEIKTESMKEYMKEYRKTKN